MPFITRITALFVWVLLLLCLACGHRKERVDDAEQRDPLSLVKPPHNSTRREKTEFMRDHYWDNFDFSDTLFLDRVDTVALLRHFGNFVSQYVGPLDAEPIRSLMQKASTSRKMMDYFVMLSETVLHDPNSPLRSDELYIPVLEAVISSPYYDKWEKIAPEYDLRIASKNRIGHKANDFQYSLHNGKRSNMYSLQAQFLILFINNPGCPMCREIIEQLKSDQFLEQMIAQGVVRVLAIYPDKDRKEFLAHAQDMDPRWINAFDPGCRIDAEELYDLKAIPALYLLDSSKTVIVKDSTSVPELSAAIWERVDRKGL